MDLIGKYYGSTPVFTEDAAALENSLPVDSLSTEETAEKPVNRFGPAVQLDMNPVSVMDAVDNFMNLGTMPCLTVKEPGLSLKELREYNAFPLNSGFRSLPG